MSIQKSLNELFDGLLEDTNMVPEFNQMVMNANKEAGNHHLRFPTIEVSRTNLRTIEFNIPSCGSFFVRENEDGVWCADGVNIFGLVLKNRPADEFVEALITMFIDEAGKFSSCPNNRMKTSAEQARFRQTTAPEDYSPFFKPFILMDNVLCDLISNHTTLPHISIHAYSMVLNELIEQGGAMAVRLLRDKYCEVISKDVLPFWQDLGEYYRECLIHIHMDYCVKNSI